MEIFTKGVGFDVCQLPWPLADLVLCLNFLFLTRTAFQSAFEATTEERKQESSVLVIEIPYIGVYFYRKLACLNEGSGYRAGVEGVEGEIAMDFLCCVGGWNRRPLGYVPALCFL